MSRRRPPSRPATVPAAGDVPAPGWRGLARHMWTRFFDDQIMMIAAGVAFYSLLALFPGIAAFVAIWGLFADVAKAQQHLARLSGVLPDETIALIGGQMAAVADTSHRGLSLAAIAGLLVSLWIANGAMMAIITGLNVAYGEKERRRYRRKLLISFVFTLGLLGFLMIVAGALVADAAIEVVAGHAAALAFALAAWPSLFLLFVSGLAMLYRFGPSRDRPAWQWFSGGGMFAGVVWLAVSIAFSLYVSAFGAYDRTYGALGAVVAFMTWTWISSIVILVGAQLNAAMDPRTSRSPP